jgi:hypothetical protein
VRWTVAFAALVLVLGCSSRPPQTNDTGARTAALTFAEALARKDWAASYSGLATETRQKWTQAEFTRRGEAFLRGLGFEAKAARVRSCEEQGGRAVAHVLFTAPRKQYRDGWELRRVGDEWKVVLPANFGGK